MIAVVVLMLLGRWEVKKIKRLSHFEGGILYPEDETDEVGFGFLFLVFCISLTICFLQTPFCFVLFLVSCFLVFSFLFVFFIFVHFSLSLKYSPTSYIFFCYCVD